MNERLSYELLISDKLEALPIPDLADAIWSRIEARLDTELPPNDKNNPPDLPVSPADLWKGTSLSILLVATLFLLTRSTKPLNNNFIPTLDKPAVILTPVTDPQQPLPDISPQALNAKVGEPVSTTFFPAAGDSAYSTADEVMPAKDSLFVPPVPLFSPPVLPVPAPNDSMVKKPRGVQGINPQDYRIEPAKKDSN